MTYDFPTFRDLLTRVEAATGPDRELDAEIQIALIPDYGARFERSPAEFVRFKDVWRTNRAEHLSHANNVADWWQCPKYTASIDAAVALIWHALPGWSWAVFGGWSAWVWPDERRDLLTGYQGYHRLPPHALISALLKALIARDTQHGNDEG